jgi:hypothetical protein
LLAAAAFRLFRIASQPPGLFQDEAVNGVNVYTILGGSPRFYFGEREPLFMYLSALVSLMLGTDPLALRVTAAFVGIFNVAAVGALGRQLFGRTIGYLAAAATATSLWLTILSRVSFRATMIPGPECLGLALLWRATQTRRLRDYALGGGVIALDFYTYLSARFLPFALIAFVVVCGVLHRKWFQTNVVGLVAAAVAAFLVCLPLGLYGLAHPEIIFGRPDQVALPSGMAFFPAFFDSSVRTLGLILVHGDVTWRHNFSGMPVFDPVSGIAFLTGLVVALRRRSPADVLVVVFFFVMLGPGMFSIDSPHYLRTIGVTGGLYILWAIGVVTLARFAGQLVGRLASAESRRQVAGKAAAAARGARWLWMQRHAAALASGLVVALAVGILSVRTAWLYFVVYPRVPDASAAFNVDLATTGRFLASQPLWHESRANVYVTDHFEADHTSVTYFLYPYLSQAEKENWLDPTNVGTFIPEDTFIPLPVAPSLYVLAGDDKVTLAALGSTVTKTQWVRNASDHPVFAVWAQPATAPAPAAPVAQLGSLLALENASVAPVQVDADGGAETTLSLWWRVLGKPAYQPSIFVHLDDSRGHSVAQADLETTLTLDEWRSGQEIVSNHVVRLPAGTAPGAYTFSVGVYDKASGHRESATEAGHPVGKVVAGTLRLDRPVGGQVQVGQPLDVPIATGLSLVGFDPIPTDVDAGATLPVTVYWKASGSARADLNAALTLTDAAGNVVGDLRQPIGSADFPTSHWATGTTIRQIADVPVSATASGNVDVKVGVVAGGAAVSAADATAALGRVVVHPTSHVYAAPSPHAPVDQTFADGGRLVGYDVGAAPAPGGNLTLTLYWQASGPSGVPYTVFVHLLDANDKVVAQKDEPPVHGTRPTTGWVAGEYVADEHVIAIDPSVPPGPYRLEVGLYDPDTGQRVALTSGGDAARIGAVRIEK